MCIEYVPKIGVIFFVWLGFFCSAVSEEEHDVLRGSHLWRVKILKIKIAEMDVCSVFFLMP